MKKLLVILSVICLFACDARDDRHIVEDGISKIMLVSDLHYLSSDLYDNGEKFNAYMATSDAKLTKYSDVLVDGIIDTVCPRCGRTEAAHRMRKVVPRIRIKQPVRCSLGDE